MRETHVKLDAVCGRWASAKTHLETVWQGTGWVNLCIKLFWALALATSSLQLTQSVLLEGASKDAQSPSLTLLLLLLPWRQFHSWMHPPLCDIFLGGPHDITRYFGNWYDNHTIFTIFYKRKYVQNLHFFLLKARSGDSWQLAKKRVDYNFFGNLYFPVSDHLWGVYFDFLCHFHLKIASPIGTFIHQ